MGLARRADNSAVVPDVKVGMEAQHPIPPFEPPRSCYRKALLLPNNVKTCSKYRHNFVVQLLCYTIFVFQMPRIWLDYCQFLMDQCRITRTRQVFDRALRALPITQHHRVWPLYLKFLKMHDIPETAVRVFRRYLKVSRTF